MKQRALGTKILLAVITLGVVAYFGMQALQYFADPLTTTAAYTYQVDRSVSLSGYVVREELVLEGGDGLFVDNAKGFVRLNLAMPRSIIEKGLKRMEEAIRRHQEARV